jgi:hypothetical protein
MDAKAGALNELEKLMQEFRISPTRLGRELCGDPSFIARLRKPETKITNVMLDKIHHYAVEKRGQERLPLED